MFHKYLTINGKKVIEETELEAFFQLDQFTCEVRNTALQVEYSEERAAFICWVQDDREFYYLDNGSGDEEPYFDLIDDVCPEERMMCYCTEDIRQIVVYFCETGGRNPQYDWTEDDFNWTNYTLKEERMFRMEHIPDLYHTMHELGYLYPSPNAIWMPEMEWLPYEDTLNYQSEPDVTPQVRPFAFTGGGDPFVFIENGSSEPYIGRHFHPEPDGEYYAYRFEDAIFRAIIDYAEEPAVWLDQGHNLQNPAENVQARLQEIHEQLQEYCRVYDGLLRQSYLDEIARLSGLPFQTCTYQGNGCWLALLSHEEAEALTRKYLYFPQIDKPFPWDIHVEEEE